MNRKLFFSVFCLVFMLNSPGFAKKIKGIDMPDTLQCGTTKLLLNGAGVRTKFFLKLYVGGLYLVKKNGNAEHIIKADESMAIRLHIISSMITSERMEEATREGFENATNGNTEPLRNQIEDFISVFKEQISEEDVYDLKYIPGTGVQVYKNNVLKAQIKGLHFKQALFGIWLCDTPAQQSLKSAMLGK